MSKGQTAREKLLGEARKQFWAKGYSSVSLRDIAGAAEVDVALVSRYFGGKQGLFAATMSDAMSYSGMFNGTLNDMTEMVVRLFAEAPVPGSEPSIVEMILINAHDEDVGPMVRAFHHDHLQEPLIKLVGCEERAALLTAALFGLSVALKTLRVPGVALPGDPRLETQVRYMIASALAFET